MRLFLICFSFVIMAAASVQAQTDAAASAGDADAAAPAAERADENQKPEPKAITIQEGRDIATNEVPGKMGRERKWKSAKYEKDIYSYSVTKDDGTLVQVDIDPDTGYVLDVEYKKLESKSALPDPKVTKAEAETAAIKHVENKADMPGFSKATVISSEYNIYNGRPAYVIRVKKHMKDYNVYVSPDTGQVTDSSLYD